MPSIAVIGAGAAGLVASRHLVKCGLRPCLFEASHSVGGSWNSQASSAYKMWNHLSPNLSKYTCCFSDHLWPDSSPAFPSQSELNTYLGDYSARYLQDDECVQFRMGCTVTDIKRCGTTPSSDSFLQPFQVEWMNQDGQSDSEQFDGVLVATGFFAQPWMPECMDTTEHITHSSEYRSPDDYSNQTVAVCGASFSALEIAADVRKRATKVISILPRIPYVVPRFVSSDASETGAYAPLDAVLYQRRQSAPQEHVTEMTQEDAQKKHAFLRGLVGERKGKALGFPKDTSSPPMVAISDDYLNLVNDGNIQVAHGRVSQTTTENNKLSIALDDGTTLTDIDKLIACTGYRSNLSFLESDILKTLDYDPTDPHAPLTLCNEAFHPQIPGLGFVGMYRGPYFGVMELQARLLAGMMSGQVMPSEEYIQETLKDSKSIRQQSPRPQFPRFDYVGFMDQLAEPLGLAPQGDYGAAGSMVSPAFYAGEDDDAQRDWKQSIDKELQQGGSANMAQVALSALIGKWSFSRSIVHFNGPPGQPPQRITGTIDFSQIAPTGDEWNSVLYHEEGLFHLPNGKDLDVFREYEYETKPDNILEIYFVEGGERAHLFLSLQFQRQKDNGYWVATSDHLCIKDLYKGTFQIKLEGLSASHVTMTYRVKGPNKDYESVTDLRPC